MQVSSLFALAWRDCGNSGNNIHVYLMHRRKSQKVGREAATEKYEVIFIGTLTQIADINGDPAAKITFRFTNNSDESCCIYEFSTRTRMASSLKIAFVTSGDVTGEHNNVKIKTGTSLDVEQT